MLARRSHASGTLGAVASGSPVAAGIGIATLLAGGNCFDAAVATALAETVCLAPKCGLAGDLVALVLAPGAAQPQALLAIGPAAAGLGAAVLDTGSLPATGGLSVGVPGAPAGYSALAAMGVLSLPTLCRPAIELARRGFTWTPQCAQLAAEADVLLVRHQPDGCAYRPARGRHAAGSQVRLPGLASLLAAFASLGAALFAGEFGEMVAAAVGRAGGVITPTDLQSAEARWQPADNIRLDSGLRAWATPGPTYGPALLRVLARADAQPLPGVVAATLAEQAARAGDGVDLGGEGTSVVAATDSDGGAVVIVHSNSFPQFGSGIVVGDLDLVLSNRAGRGFASDPTSPNFPRPHQRPLTTLHAWAVGEARPTLLGGTPGGEQQVGWNAQFLSRILASATGDEIGAGISSSRAAGIAEALAAPLWRLDREGLVAEAGDDSVSEEVTAAPVLSMRSAQVAVAPPFGGGPARAWADPRSDTLALAV